MAKIQELSLFSGAGAFEKGLQRVDPSIETVAYCEIDPHASKAYEAIHWTQGAPNLRDVREVNGIEYLDIAYLTHGSPCQDFSVAGNGKGGEAGSGTRSSLMWETVRIVLESFPRSVQWENVPNVISKKHRHVFEQYLDALAPYYNNYYQVINAKDHGIPQNRKRVFVVSIRKDIDDGTFEFPESIPLELRLRDLLEENVPSKYYLSKDQIDRLVFKPNFEKLMRGDLGVVQSYQANAYTGNGETVGTLDTAGGGGRIPPLQLVNATKAGHLPAQDGDGVVLNFLTSARGRVQEQTSPTLTTADMAGVVEVRPIINPGKPEVYQNGRRMKQNDEPAFTITTVDRHGVVLIGGTQYAIRKLTPLECWRLMDFDDSDFLAARLMGISDTQLYKIAGNSIVVSVTEAIARKLHPIILRSYEKE